MDFCGFVEHVRLPFWMFSDKTSVFLLKRFVDIIFCGFGDHLLSMLFSILDDFWMKTGAWNKKGDFMKNLVFLK